MGQIKLITTLILIGLFSIAIIGYAINFAKDNNSPIDISQDPDFSSFNSQIKSNISGFQSGSSGTYQSLLKTTINGQVAPSTAPFSITSGNALSVAKNVMKISYEKIFGNDSGFNIFLTTFIALIALMIGLYIYKTLRGNPD